MERPFTSQRHRGMSHSAGFFQILCVDAALILQSDFWKTGVATLPRQEGWSRYAPGSCGFGRIQKNGENVSNALLT